MDRLRGRGVELAGHQPALGLGTGSSVEQHGDPGGAHGGGIGSDRTRTTGCRRPPGLWNSLGRPAVLLRVPVTTDLAAPISAKRLAPYDT